MYSSGSINEPLRIEIYRLLAIELNIETEGVGTLCEADGYRVR